MIIAHRKPIPEILDSVRDKRRILVVGCATCVAECAAGGSREVETLAPLLQMALKEQGGQAEVIERTLERQCDWEFVEELAEGMGEVDAVVSLACGIGVQCVAERFAETPVLPGLNTTALAVREEPGLWASRCAACGDCVLGETFGICPVARCAKSISNGPCGGTREGGKCELDEDTDCAWCPIYRRARARGRMDALVEIRNCKDWSGSSHGGPHRMLRKDLRP